MNRRFLVLALAAALAASLAPGAALAEAKTHKVAIHVNEGDAQRMNLALNNVENIQKYYAAKGETVAVEVVTYGPGLTMLRADTSPVKDRVAAMSMQYPELRFSACENTRAGMAKREGKEIPLVKEAKSVPSGVIRLIELQEQGWSYLRP
jgi:intracellular sulfur oxidation DsrE/DsrF family protein